MKITVLGATLIVAVVVAAVLIACAFNNRKGQGPEEDQGQ